MTAESAVPRSLQAARALLAWRLRPLQRQRIRGCRVVRTANEVQLVGRVGADAQASLLIRGVSTCGSVHCCPQCAPRILSARAAEIQSALEAWDRERVAMVTFTLRHNVSIPLRLLRLLLSRAYSELKGGKGGMTMRSDVGHVGDVRASEVTFGTNGWHPHLHALWFFDAKPTDDLQQIISRRWRAKVAAVWQRLVVIALEGYVPPAGKRGSEASRRQFVGSWFAQDIERLREALRGIAVEDVLPDDSHGVNVSPVNTETYLTKMGLELGATTKIASDGHWTSWAIAHLAAEGEHWARARWIEFSGAMFGARQLTWSRGLREACNLQPERSDAELASDEGTTAEPATESLLVSIPGEAWDLPAKQRGQEWLAELYQQFADGTLQVNTWSTAEHETRPVTQPQPRSVWWHRIVPHGDKVRDWKKFFSDGLQRAQRIADWNERREAAVDAGYYFGEECPE